MNFYFYYLSIFLKQVHGSLMLPSSLLRNQHHKRDLSENRRQQEYLVNSPVTVWFCCGCCTVYYLSCNAATWWKFMPWFNRLHQVVKPAFSMTEWSKSLAMKAATHWMIFFPFAKFGNTVVFFVVAGISFSEWKWLTWFLKLEVFLRYWHTLLPSSCFPLTSRSRILSNTLFLITWSWLSAPSTIFHSICSPTV